MLPHTNYEGTSFDANWTAVEGATGYKVNVFTLDKEGKATYLFQDKAVTTNKFRVTGAESGETYFYNVAATKDSYTSIPSDKIFVFDLVAPEMKEVTNLNKDKYTAAWSTVPTAERYNYIAYYDRKAAKAGEFVVTDENFTDVRDAQGNLTGWTKEEPNPGSYSEYYIPEMKQAGWRGTNYAPYTDYICLDGWQYYHNHTDAGLISPELDMSKTMVSSLLILNLLELQQRLSTKTATKSLFTHRQLSHSSTTTRQPATTSKQNLSICQDTLTQ